MKFSGYVDYDTRNNLEHFGDGAFKPLDTGFSFLLSIFLFHAWIDYFTLLKLCAVEVCALRGLLVRYVMHVFDKCNVRVFRYNIQSILIMYQIYLANISIPFLYNGFTSDLLRNSKWKYEKWKWTSIQCDIILVTGAKSFYKSSRIGTFTYLPLHKYAVSTRICI